MIRINLYKMIAVALSILMIGCAAQQQSSPGTTADTPAGSSEGGGKDGNSEDSGQPGGAAGSSKAGQETGDVPNSGIDGAGQTTHTFSLEAVNYDFLLDGQQEPILQVEEGSAVKIELYSTDGFHDFVIDELYVATERINTGESTTIEFVASAAGTYEYYCSVGKHRELGMIGTLVVG